MSPHRVAFVFFTKFGKQMARRQGLCKLCSKVDQMNFQGTRIEKIGRLKGWHPQSVLVISPGCHRLDRGAEREIKFESCAHLPPSSRV